MKTIIIYTCIFFSYVLNANGQTHITKSIKDFGAKGNGKTDDHSAFIKAAEFFNNRKGEGKLVIPKGTYIVGKQVKGSNGAAWLGQDVLKFINCNNLTIEGTSNSIIKMRDGMKIGSYDPKTGVAYHSPKYQFTEYGFLTAPGNIFFFKNCSSVTINKLSIDGGNRTILKGGKFGDHGFQVPGDGIFIDNCSVISICNVKIDYCVRDGIQIANNTPQEWKTPSQQICITNSSFNFNGRQGLSWVGGVGLRCENNKFSNTGMGNITSAPAAGVDIEAEIGIIRDGVFINCEFVNNNGCGMVADSGPSRDISFSDCLFWGITTWSMWTTKPNYTFTNCRFYGSIVQGYDAATDADATKFRKCAFEDKNYNGKEVYGLYLVEINSKKRMIFDSCSFTSRDKKLFWFEGTYGWADNEKPIITNSTINIFNPPFKKPDFLAKMDGVRWDNNTYYIHMSEKDYSAYYIPGGSVTWMRDTKVNYIPSSKE